MTDTFDVPTNCDAAKDRQWTRFFFHDNILPFAQTFKISLTLVLATGNHNITFAVKCLVSLQNLSTAACGRIPSTIPKSYGILQQRCFNTFIVSNDRLRYSGCPVYADINTALLLSWQPANRHESLCSFHGAVKMDLQPKTIHLKKLCEGN